MDFSERTERFYEEYENSRNRVSELHKQMREISSSATSPRREVTVTVGHGGVLTGIEFPTGANKRMTPVELSALIMKTFAEARTEANEQAVTLLAPMLPDGLDARALVSGRAGIETFLPPDGPRMPTSLREFLGLRQTAT